MMPGAIALPGKGFSILVHEETPEYGGICNPACNRQYVARKGDLPHS